MKYTGLAVVLALPLAAFAFDYSYIEGGYADVDFDGLDDDSGVRIGGSAGIASKFNLFGEYTDTGDFEHLTAGGQYHTPLRQGLDFTAGASLEDVEIGRADDTGLGLRAGLRWEEPGQRFELAPEVRHIDVFDDTATSLRLGALFTVAPRLRLQGAVQGGDDDRFEAGLRYVF